MMKTDPNEEITTATGVQTETSAVAVPVEFQEAMTEDVFDEDEEKRERLTTMVKHCSPFFT